MTRQETYEKAKKDPDIIRRIVKLHVLDTINGNGRDDLNFVDGLYPAIEEMFGIDVCLECMGNKNALKDYYEENYDQGISYEQLKSYFDSAKEICDNLPIDKKDKILKVCKEFIDDVLEKIYSNKKSKNYVK